MTLNTVNLVNLHSYSLEKMLVSVTDKNGKILYVNDNFCNVTKFSKHELLGKTHRILKSGFHSPEFYSEIWKTISSGFPWHGDIKNKAKDGSSYWVRTTIIPTFDENKKIKNYVSIRTDITSQIIHSESLIKSERMLSIGQLASRVSHDVRNPLSVILMSIENLKTLYGTDIEKEPHFEKIERSIRRISHQVDDVLDFVRERSLNLELANFSEILQESIYSINVPTLTKIVLPRNDVMFYCNIPQFTVAIKNLLLNSIQAINGNGMIAISIEEKENEIVIDIEDSGDGIDKKNYLKIFEPLFTTKQQGTGLGLASVKSVIDAHGGIISVVSPPTIFTIILPKI